MSEPYYQVVTGGPVSHGEPRDLDPNGLNVSGFLATTLHDAAGRSWQAAYLEAEAKAKALEHEIDALRKELNLTIEERDAAFYELDRVLLLVRETP
jgi:hypothetical protein